MKNAAKKSAVKRTGRPRRLKVVGAPASDTNENVGTTRGPQFGEPATSPDPTKFSVKHGSDKEAYKILDSLKGSLKPQPFDPVPKTDEPILKLEAVFGPSKGKQIVNEILAASQIVFHSVGDTGNTRGPKDQNLVADKLVSDYGENNPRDVPSFFYHLGDVVYSFGEEQYYYDQFYDAYRDYPAPILAIPGNHDGMVAPNSGAIALQAFRNNFCATGWSRNSAAGQLARTAQVQPGIYFTLEAPFVRILGVYSNCLEDPGVISTQGGTYPDLTDVQLNFLKAALARVKEEEYPGALLIAVHHPPYVATTPSAGASGKHGGSPLMLKDIDSACKDAGVWPHAVLSGHAHNYQRFTRQKGGRETPFIVAGNGGHAVNKLTKKGTPALRTPALQPLLSDGSDSVVFENYDDQDFGYLRIIVDSTQLRIEYHPSPDGEDAKTPDDFVTVNLGSRKLVHFQVG